MISDSSYLQPIVKHFYGLTNPHESDLEASGVTNMNVLLRTSIYNGRVMGMTNKLIMKWKCFVRLSNFPTNSVRKCTEIIRENLWMWILGLKWVKLHLELNSP